VNHIKKNNYVSICTPWDELAVDYVESKNFDIIKVASCSFNDWNLLEKIVTKNRFIIASISRESRCSNSSTNYTFKDRHISIDDIQIHKEETPYTFNAVDLYLMNEKDSVMKYAAEAYIVKGYNTVRKFNDYFGISINSSRQFIDKIKENIKKYETI
jgi:sialic acid synthase SpsE